MKVKGYPHLEHNGVYVVNKNDSDYEIALARLKRQSIYENERAEIRILREEVDNLKDNINDIQDKLNTLISLLGK